MPFTADYFVKPERRAYTEEAKVVHENGRIGILMLHGFMGSPLSSRPMAKHLAGRGITVHCPLLPGHGEHPNRMRGIKREAWIAETAEAYRCFRSQVDELFIMGHSMGSVLGAMLCNEHPEQIRGLMMLAPLYDTPDKRLNLFRPLHYVLPWFYPTWLPSRSMRKIIRERVEDYDMSMDDPEVQQNLREFAKVPTGALYEMLKMGDFSRSDVWPHFEHPCIIFRGGHDPAVPLSSVQNLCAVIGATDDVVHHFPQSGHEVMRTLDPAHKEVWALTYQFVRGHSKVGLPETAVGRQTSV